ncbi:MAG: undecaprenyl/decaprenyl-phosphate alpha-N-acetylglucosaminyl 1-phosphate transferase [Lentisphaeria bacterium]|nr:undecaprenyl/decaprenyl-phosphate alpha-N-acetylglucosaminyl 1-phosphate transferase [Lentisphaeria bacterium]
MFNWYHIYAFIFLIGLILSLVNTPIFQYIAEKLDFVDRPKGEKHKLHAKPIPLLGGCSMYLSWLTVILAGYFIIKYDIFNIYATHLELYRNGFLAVSTRMLVLAGCAGGAVFVGLLDDKSAMLAWQKFALQFVIAIIAVAFGNVRITLFIDNIFLTSCISVFWIVLLMNAINFFDNMDGLAVGTVAIAMAFFCAVAIINEQFFMATFTALNFGVCVGFWFYNASPATIFMGDSGSHLLGFLTAVCSSGITYYNSTEQSYLAVLIPFFILAVPLFDTLVVCMIRFKNHKPFWIGDHNHISHRFVKMGFSRRTAVNLVHILCLITGAGVLPLMWGNESTAFILVVQGILLLLLITVMQIISLYNEEKN